MKVSFTKTTGQIGNCYCPSFRLYCLLAGWGFLSRELDEYIEVLPPQQRIDEHWYKGTADAIYQNIYTIEKADPKYVLILAGDHIYKMDYGDMIRSHLDTGADLTVGCIPVPVARIQPLRRHAGRRATTAIIGFQEKPKEPLPMPGDPEHVPGVDGHLRLHRPAHVRAAVPGRRPEPTATTISARTSSRP